MLAEIYVLALLRCGAERCAIFYPTPGFRYESAEHCRKDALAIAPPPGASAVCMVVPKTLLARRK